MDSNPIQPILIGRWDEGELVEVFDQSIQEWRKPTDAEQRATEIPDYPDDYPIA